MSDPFPPSSLVELRAWRLLGADLAPQLDRILAAQGDGVDRDLLRLQHALAELRALSPAGTATTNLLMKIVRESDGTRYVQEQIAAAIDDLAPPSVSVRCAVGRLEHALTVLREAAKK